MDLGEHHPGSWGRGGGAGPRGWEVPGGIYLKHKLNLPDSRVEAQPFSTNP